MSDPVVVDTLNGRVQISLGGAEPTIGLIVEREASVAGTLIRPEQAEQIATILLQAVAYKVPPERKMAKEVLSKLLSDPEMWATHGMPPEGKLRRLEDEFTAAFKR